MATTTFQGVTRSYGGGKKKDVSPGVLTMSVVASYLASSTDATVATANLRIGTSSTVGEFFVLPKGAIPISVMPVNADVTGASPTTDIGSAVDPDGFFNEVAAASKGVIKGADGALVTELGILFDTQVTAVKGATTTGGGTGTVVITYTVADNGKDGSIQ